MPRGKRKNLKFITETHPNLVKEWDWLRNQVNPSEVSYGSHAKINWICSEGHSWLVSVNSRTSHDSGCPFCHGLKASPKNRLDLEFPQILSIFDYQKSGVNPNEVSISSHKKIYIFCQKCNQSFATSPNKLQYGSIHCQACNGTTSHSKNRSTIQKYLEYCSDKIFYKNKKGLETSKYWISAEITSLRLKGSKNHKWDLTKDQVANLIFANCHYCREHHYKKMGI
jgi:hypothetical protein